MRWEEEDERPRVRYRTAEDPKLDKLTAEGITLREKIEREKKAAAAIQAADEETAAQERLKAKRAARPTRAAP